MDVLNTYGGGVDSGAVAAIALCGVFALIFIVLAFLTKEYGLLVVTAFCALIIFVASINARTPVRHEVTLRPGAVIDATKYDIVEQRGQIYVIEEQEVGE